MKRIWLQVFIDISQETEHISQAQQITLLSELSLLWLQHLYIYTNHTVTINQF